MTVNSDYHDIRFYEEPALVTYAVDWLQGRIKDAIAQHGHANVFLSGGSSPKTIYGALSSVNLPWDKVTISLVDERWVDEDSAGSNTAMIKSVMLQNAAAKANFIPIYNGAETAEKGVKQVEPTFPDRLDICVMGMGPDSHTASWFPDSGGLDRAMDVQNKATLCALDATGCPVAGDYPERISLTRSAVLEAGNVLLLLPNKEKTTIFDATKDNDPLVAPVAGLIAAGNKLTVFAMTISQEQQ